MESVVFRIYHEKKVKPFCSAWNAWKKIKLKKTSFDLDRFWENFLLEIAKGILAGRFPDGVS